MGERTKYKEKYKISEEDIKQFQKKVREDWLEEVEKLGGMDAVRKARSMTLPELQIFLNHLKERNEGT